MDTFRISDDELEKWSEIDAVKFNKDNSKVLHLEEIKCTNINGLGSMLTRKDPGVAVHHKLNLSGLVCMTLKFH